MMKLRSRFQTTVMVSFTLMFFLPVFGISSQLAQAADWPMWKADASRSGSTAEQLPDQLDLIWSRDLPVKNTAWPNEPRLQYDVAHEPIVSGNQLFLGFSDDGSLRAYDTKTGQENWVFYTNGPVRFSPVAFQDRIIAGSDDGYLYCLNATSGKLEWKVSGAPVEREQRLHLGNQKLISFWPVRGGPVIAEGIVYFAAGIWPSMGVFVNAVEIETGKILWRNQNSHHLKNIRLDHNVKRESGLSPQGYLLISGETLLIPNGRSMPAGLKRSDGSFLYYVQGYRNGDSRVITTEQFALVGETGAISIADGREIGSRWTSAGKEAPDGPDFSKVELFEGPLFPYHSLPGCTFRSAISEQVIYGMHQGTMYAYDVGRNNVDLQETEFHKRKLKTARWVLPNQWNFQLPIKDNSQKSNSSNNITILAGNQLISHHGRELFALQIPKAAQKKPQLVWQKSLESDVASLVVADQKLFVSTSDNKLLVFGSTEENVSPSVHSKQATLSRNEVETPIAPSAEEILKQVDVSEGYALVLGLKSGALVDEFLQHTKMNVIAVDSDESKINRLRKKYRFDKTLSSRFQGFLQEPADMVLPPYMANLITSELPLGDRVAPNSLPRLYQSLRPYGGAIFFIMTSSNETSALKKQIQDLSLPKAKLNISENWLILHRSGSLPGASDWTHETGDAARSYYSRDELVKSPLAVLWYGDAPGYGFYKKKDYAHGVKPQVAGGKLFALQLFSNTLFAIDVYTGWQLWSKKIPVSSRYASFPEKIYVASGRQCDVLDTQTGDLLKTYAYDLSKHHNIETSATDIRVDENIVLVGLRKNKENAISKGRWNNHLLIALNRTTGEQLWIREALHRFNTAALAMADGMVFCIDSPSYMQLKKLNRRGQPTDSLQTTLYALDASSGEIQWEQPLLNSSAKINDLHFLGMRVKDDWLEYSSEKKLLLAGRGHEIFALNATTGKEVWKNQQLGLQPLILQEETFVNQGGYKYDLQTGKKISDTRFFERGGCNYAVGGKHLLFLRNYCASYIESDTGKQYSLRNLRTGCSNSFVAADGLLTMPCFSSGCVCNYPIQTSFGMFHLEEMKIWEASAQENDSP